MDLPKLELSLQQLAKIDALKRTHEVILVQLRLTKRAYGVACLPPMTQNPPGTARYLLRASQGNSKTYTCGTESLFITVNLQRSPA